MNPDITFRVYFFMNMALVFPENYWNSAEFELKSNFVGRCKDELDLEDCDLIVLDVL